jgi:Mrp family chromosome partitioning ATPase
MKQLTDGLAAILQQGRKVLGLASCNTGEGVTTLLVAAGRCLAERGLRVVLVDLNPARPYLAQFLGLLPQAGWEDVVAGRLPPEEVVIESLGDHLAVLPACRPAEAPATDPAAAESSVAAALETLAAHYDAVLLDLGPLEGRGPAGGPLSEAVRRRLDAVVLVHNVRSTTPNRLTDLEVSLAAAGIACAGVVENFVAR